MRVIAGNRYVLDAQRVAVKARRNPVRSPGGTHGKRKKKARSQRDPGYSTPRRDRGRVAPGRPRARRRFSADLRRRNDRGRYPDAIVPAHVRQEEKIGFL